MERVNAMFNVPDEMLFHCCIPLGYPRGRFGPLNRKPVLSVSSRDRFGNDTGWE